MAVQPAPQPRVTAHQFTIDDYYRMAEVGILTEDDRVELIDGEIVDMNPIGASHSGHINRVVRVFRQLGVDRALLSVQNPVRLGPRAEPVPDVALLRPHADAYTSSHPTPADVFLLVEVADSSLAYDRQVKAPLYSRHGIQELWIVDLIHGYVEIYRDPSPEGFRSLHTAQPGDTIHPMAFPDLMVAIVDVLG